MNKRDFYKQLMEEYEFDKDKILANAKKGKFAGRSPMPIYIGITAAAAAVIVGVGTVLFTSVGHNRGVELTGGTLTALSNKERIEKAIEDIRRNENSGELHDVMVTFVQPLTPAEVQMVLTENADSSVPVKMLYFSDESRVVGAEAVGQVFESGEGMVTGAVINCAGYLLNQLDRSSAVFKVELMGAEDDINVVAPINTSDPEIGGTLPVTGDNTGETPTIPDDPYQGEPGGFDNSGESSDTSSSETDDTSDESSDTSSSETDDTSSESSDTSSDNESSDTSEPNVEIIPEKPEEIAPEIVLPENTAGFSYVTNEIGAQDAFFIDEDSFLAITDTGISLYDFDGSTANLTVSKEMSGVKIEWVSSDGTELLVSAVSGGQRNKLYSVNTKFYSINELNIDGMVMAGTVTDIVYNSECGILVLNINDGGRYYTCSAKYDGISFSYMRICCYSPDAVTKILAVNENYVYLCVEKDGVSSIAKASVDSSSDPIAISSGSGPASVSTSFSGTAAAVTLPTGTYIFDCATETLISAPASGVIKFGISENCFSCGGAYYQIINGSVSAVGGLSHVAEIDWKNGLSGKYNAKAAGGCVEITESSYTAKNADTHLMYDLPAENASFEMRKAVNEAVGIQNALSKSSVSACGIGSADLLSSTIDAIYTETAAAEMKNRCNIAASGELYYTNGGLSAINVSETVLYMHADDGLTATGVLYVKAGVFDGRTGYTAVNVKLVKVGARWKLDAPLV